MRIPPAAATFLVSFLFTSAGFAQTLEVGARGAIRIEIDRVEARIEEGVARVEVDETFRSSSPNVLEGVYKFKLPADAVIGAFSMWMEGKEKQGRVLEAKEARAVYDSIVRKKRDPGLLEQTGWRDFRVSVFPIPANDTVRIKLVYSHLLRDDAGLETLEIPLPQESGTIGDLRVHVNVTGSQLPAGLDCPSHKAAKLAIGDAGAEASMSGDGIAPSGPFVLRVIPRKGSGEFGVTLLADRAAGSERGYFVARVVPRLAEPVAIARDLVFVIDRSGSMEGKKIEQARAALRAGLDSLRPGDRFDVVSFASDVTTLGDGRLLDATEENLSRARRAAAEITASGGTNIHEALLSTIRARGHTEQAPFGAGGRFFAVVFLTDGDPTVGVTEPDAILKMWRKEAVGARLFAFGVGDDVKEFLLTKLATEGRGEARYVREEESLEVPLAALFDRVKTPLLLDPTVEVEGDGVELLDREPRRLPDLFLGRTLVVSGRFKGSGKATLHLRGRSGAREVVVDVPVEFPAATPARPHVGQIWAKSRVERLLDDMRTVGGNVEIRKEILSLGLDHQLVTPYTSFLVVEDGVKLAQSDADARPRGGQADEGSAFDRAPDAARGSAGQPRGPADSVPPGVGGGGDTTPPGNPGGPATPGPGAPTSGGPRGPATGGPPVPSGAGGTLIGRSKSSGDVDEGGIRGCSGGLTGRRNSGEGYERWEFWWENNKDPFFEFQARLGQRRVVAGAGSGSIGSRRTTSDYWENRPSPSEIRSTIVPALLEGLTNTKADIADSAALAIARSVRLEDVDKATVDALIKTLGHQERSAREAATLALGVLGAVDSIDTLRGILNDSPEARKLTNHPEGVEHLVRAFAAASLGLLHAQAAVPDLKEAVNDSKMKNLGVKGMAVLALGMMRENHDDLVSYLLGLMQDRSVNNLVRAQAPIALGRLQLMNDDGSPAVRQILVSKVVPLFNDDKTDNDLRRSLAILIGMVATTDETDAPAVDALINAVANAKDDQTRHFSIMALAEIGARDREPARHLDTHARLKEFFLRELTTPKRITHQPYGALGFAVYARNPRIPDLRDEVSRKLQAAFNETTNPSYQGAMAIGLGLLEANAAASDLWKKFEDTNDQTLKGYIAVSLGLMRENSRAAALRDEMMKKDLDRKYRLELARALGLMSDVDALPDLIAYLKSAATLAEISSAAQAIGLIGDKSAVTPLLEIVRDESQPPMSRGFAEAALGILAEKTPLPWYIVFSVDANYRAKPDALSELLDLL